MNDLLENQVSRANKVNEFITLHTTDLTATPEIAAVLQSQLQAAIAKAEQDDAKATENDTGYATEKEAARTQLEEDIFHISTGIVSYADDNDDFITMNMFDFPFSALQGFRDTRLAQFAQTVIDKASEPAIAAALATDHNVSAADLTQATTTLADYNAAMGKPRQHVGEKSAYNKQVVRDVRAVKDILDRVARKMATYRSGNRLLFDAFEACNSIDDTGAHSGTTINGTVNAGETKFIISIAYNASAPVSLKNTATVSLEFIVYNAGAPNGSIIVAPAATVTTTLGAIAGTGDMLYVKNTSGTAGSYQVNI